MDHGEEVLGQLIVAGSNTPEVLELGEEAFDQVPLAVEPSAEVRFRPAVGLRWDIGECAPLAERRPDAVGIVCLIGQHYRSGTHMVEQAISSMTVMALPGGQAQPDREALPFDDRGDFCREPPRERPRQ